MQITVNGQRIAIVDDTLVSNSVNIYECEFEFDASWDGFAKTSVWQLNSDDPIEVVINSGVAVIPHEVLENAGILRIGVYGTKDEKVMPTVWLEKRKVCLGTPTGSIGTEPTPSIYAQILAVATEAKEIADDVKTEWDSVSATAETLPSGSSASVEFEGNTFTFGIPQGEKGEQGETPSITVIPITGGHRIIITVGGSGQIFNVMDGQDGQRGADGVGITDIELTSDYCLEITLSNGTAYTTSSIRGEKGETGNGIASIEKTATVGKVDTYTITFTDGTTTTFDVTNGEVTEESLEERLIDKADVILHSASGTIATFNDGSAMPIKELVVDINAIQDLHGQSSPYPAGGGKNKLNVYNMVAPASSTATVQISNEKVTVTWINGAIFLTGKNVQTFEAGTYTLSITGSNTSKIRAEFCSVATGATLKNGTPPLTYTADEPFYITFYGDYTASDKTASFTAQLESGSTATSWSPYENICPISGWDAVNVTDCGKNLWNPNRSDKERGYYNLNGEFYSTSDYVCLSFPCSSGDKFVKSGDGWGGIVTFWNNDTFVSGTNATTVTIPNGVNKVKFACLLSSTNAQLELGSTASSFAEYQGITYPISLGQTVYGGWREVISGEQGVTHGVVDLGELDWTLIGSRFQSNTLIDDIKTSAADYSSFLKCSILNPSNSPITSQTVDNTIATYNRRLYALASSCSSASEFKALMNGQKLVYELANPITTTLTPTDITTLEGVNNIWADCGDVAVIYRADTKRYIDGTIVDVPLAMIAPIEKGTTSSRAYAVGEYFILNGNQFCKAKTSIASGATFTLNTNYTVTTIGAELKALQ